MEYKKQYSRQKSNARRRKIEWDFTYDEWLKWWGTDITKRGIYKGQLCMARYNDVGPYHPNNVTKQLIEDNVRDAHKGKPKTTEIGFNSIYRTCPHCGLTTNIGNATQWHFDNCKKLTTKEIE